MSNTFGVMLIGLGFIGFILFLLFSILYYYKKKREEIKPTLDLVGARMDSYKLIKSVYYDLYGSMDGKTISIKIWDNDIFEKYTRISVNVKKRFENRINIHPSGWGFFRSPDPFSRESHLFKKELPEYTVKCKDDKTVGVVLNEGVRKVIEQMRYGSKFFLLEMHDGYVEYTCSEWILDPTRLNTVLDHVVKVCKLIDKAMEVK